MSVQSDTVREYLRKFPKSPTQTLAKIVYKENKSTFASQECVRSVIRRLRGAIGVELSKYTEPEFQREKQQPGDPFPKLPEPWDDLRPFDTFTVHGPVNTAILSDIHIPFHDKTALEAAIAWLKKRSVDLVLLNGDMADMFWGSDFLRDPRLVDFHRETEDVKEFLTYLRATFPKARIVYKLGNHEERWERYMAVKATELFGAPEFEYSHIHHFKDLGIEEVKDQRRILLGSIHVLHGHEYRGISRGVEDPAKWLYKKAHVISLCGHFHRTGQYSEPDLNDKVISTWTTGCLCRLHPDWFRLNKWNHGFSYTEIDAENKFHIWNPRIIDGVVYE